LCCAESDPSSEAIRQGATAIFTVNDFREEGAGVTGPLLHTLRRSTALRQTYGFPFVGGGTGRFGPRFTSISGGIGFSRDFNFGKLG